MASRGVDNSSTFEHYQVVQIDESHSSECYIFRDPISAHFLRVGIVLFKLVPGVVNGSSKVHVDRVNHTPVFSLVDLAGVPDSADVNLIEGELTELTIKGPR